MNRVLCNCNDNVSSLAMNTSLQRLCEEAVILFRQDFNYRRLTVIKFESLLQTHLTIEEVKVAVDDVIRKKKKIG